MTRLRRFSRLLGDQRGAAAIEFAVLAPVLVMLLLGLMDLAYQSYAKTVLEGALQKAGRDSGIEAANTTAIDNKVKASVLTVSKYATFEFERKNYSTFAKITPERFTDSNNNGVRNTGECFDDVNGNRVWDADPGLAGQGNAGDVTLYTVTVTYPRLFPISAMFGWPTTETTTASTLLKNQPYATQSVPTLVSICT